MNSPLAIFGSQRCFCSVDVDVVRDESAVHRGADAEAHFGQFERSLEDREVVHERSAAAAIFLRNGGA
jgi:hypothetical protein